MDSFDLDKALGILCITAIAIVSMWQMPGQSNTIVIPAVTAIAGFVTGRMSVTNGNGAK